MIIAADTNKSLLEKVGACKGPWKKGGLRKLEGLASHKLGTSMASMDRNAAKI